MKPVKYLHRLKERRLAADGSVIKLLDKYRSSGRQEIDNPWYPARQPQPTTAWPGTPEKVEVLAARLLAGEDLWHPDDAGGLLCSDISALAELFTTAQDTRRPAC